MSIIETLKNEERIYKYWSDEEKGEADRIGVKNFLVYVNYTGDTGFSYRKSLDNKFNEDCNYQLRPDYQEQPEFEYYEIKLKYEAYSIDYKNCHWGVHKFCKLKGFVGFLGEDGKINGDFIYGWGTVSNARVWYWIEKELKSGLVVIKHATHAVFVKEK